MNTPNIADGPLILLVADSDDDRELYCVGMPLYGFRVRCTTLDGLRQAVEVERPDVLVLNLRLGADNLWRSIEKLQCGGALHVPGVLLTGSVRADGANRRRARRTGCAAFVATPCSPSALARVLGAVLRGASGLVVLHPDTFDAGRVPRA